MSIPRSVGTVFLDELCKKSGGIAGEHEHDQRVIAGKQQLDRGIQLPVGGSLLIDRDAHSIGVEPHARGVSFLGSFRSSRHASILVLHGRSEQLGAEQRSARSNRTDTALIYGLGTA